MRRQFDSDIDLLNAAIAQWLVLRSSKPEMPVRVWLAARMELEAVEGVTSSNLIDVRYIIQM